NHAPQEFEDALDGVPGVRTGCAVALGFVPPAGDGEELLLLVETTSGARPDLAREAAPLRGTPALGHGRAPSPGAGDRGAAGGRDAPLGPGARAGAGPRSPGARDV